MKIFFSVNVLAMMAASGMVRGSVLPTTEDYKASLEVDRPSMTFDNVLEENNGRKSGYTYVDTFRTESTSSIPMGGVDMKTATTMQLENEMSVKDIQGGGQELTIRTNEVFFDVSSAGVNVHCDSKDPTSRDQPACAQLMALVDVDSLTIIVDDHGNIAEATGANAEAVTKFDHLVHGQNNEQEGGDDDVTKTATQQLQTQFMETARILQLVPKHAVKPGDQWPVNVMMGDLGSMEGTASLLGYKKFEGSDCAVIYVDAEMHLNLDELMQSMGLPAETFSSKPIDAPTTQVIYWDHEQDLARWSQANSTYVMEMKNAVDGSMMSIPVEQSTSMMTEIKGKIEEDAPIVTLAGDRKHTHSLTFSFLILSVCGIAVVVSLILVRKIGNKRQEVKPAPATASGKHEYDTLTTVEMEMK